MSPPKKNLGKIMPAFQFSDLAYLRDERYGAPKFEVFFTLFVWPVLAWCLRSQTPKRVFRRKFCMPDPPPLMIFFQFVSKKIDLGQKLPLRGQISPTKFIILWQNFYVYAPKSIKTHCFLTHDTHRKILILL